MTDDADRIWRPEEILRRYQAGDRNFRDLQIWAPTGTLDLAFRDADLSEADFSGCFIEADFEGAILRNAKFSANLKCSNFSRADLRGADFSNAAIDAATFDGADLADANFEGAGAFGYIFKKGERP